MSHIDQQYIAEFSRLVAQSRKIVITCHVSPDGDAVGSSLALMNVLRAMGKLAYVVTPDLPPQILSFLPGAKDIVVATRFIDRAHNLIMSADLLFYLDFNSLKRVDRLGPVLLSSAAPRILIDHHLDPEDIADVIISDHHSSSTCGLLFDVLSQAGFSQFIGREAATCIYTGMMTDTGNFTYNSNDPDIYYKIAELLKLGVDKDDVYRRVINTNSPGRLRLCGYSLYRKMELFPRYKAALITLSRQELDDFGYEKGDTESLVNVPLSIPEITYSVFMRQDDPDYVKISTRSKGDCPVNVLCERYFGGGGHKNAAGGEWRGSLDEAVCRMLSAMEEFSAMVPESTVSKE